MLVLDQELHDLAALLVADLLPGHAQVLQGLVDDRGLDEDPNLGWQKGQSRDRVFERSIIHLEVVDHITEGAF